jgi:hypothetical protein
MGVRTVTTQTAQDKLRNELLISSLYDDIPLAQIEGAITRDHLAEGPAQIQQLALSVIRSLVEDGLMMFVGGENVDIDEAMERVRGLFVDQYDDPGAWVFAVWLKATESGRRAAEALKTNTN